MKTWIRRSLIGLFGVAVIAGGVAACGLPHRGHGFTPLSADDAARWRQRAIERATAKLQLDAAQQQKLGALFDTLREQRNALIGSTADPRADMAALIAGTRFDRARAQALVDHKTAALVAGAPQAIAALGDFYDSLDAGQQGKLRDLLGRRRHGWRS